MTMRTNRYDERDNLAEQPTPETPEPLEEEARRERAVADAGRDEHEGPGPVYSPSDAYTAGYTDGTARDADERVYPRDTTPETGGDAQTDETTDADGDGSRFRQPYGQAGDDVLTSPQSGGRHTAEGDLLVAGGRTDDYTEPGTQAGRSDDATGAYGTYGDDAHRDAETDGTGYARDGVTGGDATTGATVDGPVAYPVTTTTAASGAASVLDEALDSRWREIKTGFVDDPRQSVEQADALVEEALSALTSRRQALLDKWKDNERGDTEALRLALHEYHALLAHLTRK
ncbi:hypothetical protein [Microbispora sp. KK1-11]|uniref:hypothetical protein n=1 Tax=Microbispora sp. KK1-11 TaxID=2053005 RepID=UPI001156CF4E|nr:hypothetical protein [Microbispora sp. KK1-11]TQS31212.1 hypothetical protein FLW16_02800 [Microbispora sp. KK1-11]